MLTRRQFLKTLAGTTLASAAGLGGYTRFIEPYWVDFERVSLPVRHLPPALVGQTLVHISDMHIGNRFDWGYIVRALRRVQALEPAFVVYTGDFVSFESAEQYEQLDEVMRSAALGRLGTVAVLGNHDYGRGWVHPEVANRIHEILEARGVNVLRNESISVGGLDIVGIDDYWGTYFHPERAMAQVAVERPSIALCHNPDVVDLEVWGRFEGWILSGHTHGGQVKPPFLPPPQLPVQNLRYVAGKYALEGGRNLYINRGLGNLWPVRFNVRPEVTLFRLEPA